MNSSAAFRRTKIIATLGPATESEPMLEQLIRAGVDVIRLNMAHARHDWTRTIIRRIRTVSQRVDREVATTPALPGYVGVVKEVVPSYADKAIGYNVLIDNDPRSGRIWFFWEEQLRPG